MARDIELPFLLRDGQFLPGLLALWEEAYRLGADKPLRIDEKPVERGAAAGGDDGDGAGRQRLSIRALRIVTDAAATRAASRRKAHLRASASTSSTPAIPMIASTSPGNPAPLPRSIRLSAAAGISG